MLLLGVTGFGDPLAVTARSACPAEATTVVAVASVLFFFGVGVFALTSAVAEITVPAAVPAFTFSTTGNVEDPPDANDELVQVSVPVPPTGMVLQDQPLGGVNAAPSVVFAGMASAKVTNAAVAGPL